MLSLRAQALNGHVTMLPMDEVHSGTGSIDGLAGALGKHGVSRAAIVAGNPRPATTTDQAFRLLHEA